MQVATLPQCTPDERLVYKKFVKDTKGDHRYLRGDRWIEIKRIITTYKLKKALEFGSGISTILFPLNGLSLVSCETDEKYMEFVRTLAAPTVDFRLWDNLVSPLRHDERFDIGLVDGILPRNKQAELAIKHCRFVVLDDSVRDIKRSLWALFTPYKRVDLETTIVSIFKIH